MLAGCQSPLDGPSTQALRESTFEAVQREKTPALNSDGSIPEPRQLTRTPNPLTFRQEIQQELDKMAGPLSYTDQLPDMGPDLLGNKTFTFPLSLRQAITSAVEKNLAVQTAQLEPSITAAQALAAEAAFDWVFFADFSWQDIDTPQQAPQVGAFPTGVGATMRQSVSYNTGLRKPLTTGGAFRVLQGQTYLDEESPGSNFSPDPSNAALLSVEFSQPLLRNLGSDVTLAQVRLARNAERASVQQLKNDLLAVVTETERAYWDLYLARRNLQIQRRLLERGVETRDVLESRRNFDVKPAEFSDAVANVARREGNVIRAVNELRKASDRLKVLINDPGLPVGDERLLVPVDEPIDAPITFSLIDSITQALDNRPEVQQAVLDIDDTAIRLTVADNARLPMLDLTMQTAFHGLDENTGKAYEQIGDSRFVDYIVRLDFEQPLGNRAAESIFRQRTLERLRATVNYRRVVQDVVLSVKTAMRDVETNYRLIEQTRSSRLAATENLRTLLVQEKTIQALSPDFLDLKFRRQEALAAAEIEEAQALVDYSVSLAVLNRAIGLSLERNQIRFVVPHYNGSSGGQR